MSRTEPFEQEVENFFNSFTANGETVLVADILDAVPQCGLELEDPRLFRVLALFSDAQVETLSLSDMYTLFAVSDPLSEEDKLAVFVDAKSQLPDDLTFPEFVDRTN